jgi:Rel/ankyrin family protein
MDQYLNLNSNATKAQPYVRIVEQPAKCALRFRYECEGRSAGSIPGSNSTADNKTYPTIQVCNYRGGQAVVVVSCVTKDQPYRPHPHNLVGKEGCKKGVCTMVINNADMICSFTSLGIQCVKRKDIEDSLKLRESIKVDPFRSNYLPIN